MVVVRIIYAIESKEKKYSMLKTFNKESPDGIMDEYEKLRNDLQKIYEEAPNTSNKACKEAKIEIENGNFGIYTDDEIDQLLPKILRGNQSDIMV